jgi:hypothetical protein
MYSTDTNGESKEPATGRCSETKEIEVTPEMIEAGWTTLVESGIMGRGENGSPENEEEENREAIRAVFFAMLRSARLPLSEQASRTRTAKHNLTVDGFAP